MSTRALMLDEEHFRAVEKKSRTLGKTPEQYIHALIDADRRSFDELLQPVRQGFDHVTDAEVDELSDRPLRTEPIGFPRSSPGHDAGCHPRCQTDAGE
jgi:hypothetical protein